MHIYKTVDKSVSYTCVRPPLHPQSPLPRLRRCLLTLGRPRRGCGPEIWRGYHAWDHARWSKSLKLPPRRPARALLHSGPHAPSPKSHWMRGWGKARSGQKFLREQGVIGGDQERMEERGSKVSFSSRPSDPLLAILTS